MANSCALNITSNMLILNFSVRRVFKVQVSLYFLSLIGFLTRKEGC